MKGANGVSNIVGAVIVRAVGAVVTDEVATGCVALDVLIGGNAADIVGFKEQSGFASGANEPHPGRGFTYTGDASSLTYWESLDVDEVEQGSVVRCEAREEQRNGKSWFTIVV